MAELLFIATTIFVAYVVFEVVGKKKAKPDIAEVTEKPVSTAKPVAPVEKIAPAQPVVTAKPVKKTASTKTKAAPAKSDAAPTANSANDSLKNPKTGETAKLPANYAFAKRWIKDALVEEGLLDRVYKNNELDSATTTKIQLALQQLKAMEKYQ